MIVIYLIVNSATFLKNTLSTNSLIIIKTLNHEHGAIQNLLPQTKQQFYIERSILDELDKSNQPKQN